MSNRVKPQREICTKFDHTASRCVSCATHHSQNLPCFFHPIFLNPPTLSHFPHFSTTVVTLDLNHNNHWYPNLEVTNHLIHCLNNLFRGPKYGGASQVYVENRAGLPILNFGL